MWHRVVASLLLALVLFGGSSFGYGLATTVMRTPSYGMAQMPQTNYFAPSSPHNFQNFSPRYSQGTDFGNSVFASSGGLYLDDSGRFHPDGIGGTYFGGVPFSNVGPDFVILTPHQLHVLNHGGEDAMGDPPAPVHPDDPSYGNFVSMDLQRLLAGNHYPCTYNATFVAVEPGLVATPEDFARLQTAMGRSRLLLSSHQLAIVHGGEGMQARLRAFQRPVNRVLLIHSIPTSRDEANIIHGPLRTQENWERLVGDASALARQRNVRVLRLQSTSGSPSAAALRAIREATPDTLVLFVGHVSASPSGGGLVMSDGSTMTVESVHGATGGAARWIIGCNTDRCMTSVGDAPTLVSSSPVNYREGIAIASDIIRARREHQDASSPFRVLDAALALQRRAIESHDRMIQDGTRPTIFSNIHFRATRPRSRTRGSFKPVRN